MSPEQIIKYLKMRIRNAQRVHARTKWEHVKHRNSGKIIAFRDAIREVNRLR